MNSVNLMGRLVKDTEANSSGKMAMNTIAVEGDFKDKDGNKQTDFLNVRWFGEKNINFAMQYLKKGMKIGITGAVKSSSYTDANGNKKTITYILANSVDFCEKKQDNQASFDSFATPQQQTPQFTNDFSDPNGLPF